MTTEKNNTNPEAAVPVDQNQKAVANPATQTLFRFVSLRNPQLAKKEGNLKFIFRDDNVEETTFDQLAIQWNQNPNLAPSKIDYYIKKIISNPEWFQNRIKSEKHFKELYTDLYSIVKKFAMEGVESLSEDDLNDVRNTQPNMQYIWTTIIYQIVMQEDFYLKELMSQLLQLIHYVENQDYFSSETNAEKKKEKQKELATAKVVIPDFLFVDSATVPTVQQNRDFTVGTSAVGSNDAIKGANANRVQEQNVENSVAVDATYLPTESMLKRQKVALASSEKTQLEDLKKDLTKAQNIYRKQYSKAYGLASKDYQNLIKPLYDDYDQSLLEVEATFTEEMTAAAKKLALSQVAKPEVPEFQFEFRKERDISFLQSKLSENSLKSFVNLIGEYAESESLSGRLNNGEVLQENIVAIGDDQFILPADENQNFDEMLETINAKLSDLNDTIYQNTEVEKQQYASVGGVLIPVNNEEVQDKSENYMFMAQTLTVAPNMWSVVVTFQASNVSIVSADYKAQGKSKEIKSTELDKIGSASYRLFNNQSFIQPNDVSEGGFTVSGILKLSDGKDYHMDFTLIRDSNYPINAASGQYSTFGYNCYIMPYTPPTNPGNENPDNPSEPENPGNTNTPVSTNNTFVPKGFGIKRLGIADYLKVEQTTHAYVEGEVANIENIMAREYRSQSTRRLRRSETTETSSSDKERERSTDTTTSSRFEMQSEIAKILQEATDIGINANTSYSNNTSFGNFSAQLGASYANHRSKEDSMRQAVTQAQDVTVRALDRVVTKVHQERIEKMIEEFEENNTHGFDNRKGNQHVVGVYRWVDKLMKNQVWNYGKRLMFEFAIPQPSKLHTLAAASVKKVIQKPVDPRTADNLTMKDYTDLSDEKVLKRWTSTYNVEIEEKLSEYCNITKSFSGRDSAFSGKDEEKTQIVNGNGEVIIPEGYIATEVRYLFNTYPHGFKGYHQAFISVAGISSEWITDVQTTQKGGVISGLNVKERLEFSFATGESPIIQGSLDVKCELTEEAKKQYQQKTFNAIIEAYEDALAEYNDKIAQEDAKASSIKDGNPMFYRQIEQEVLKHNSIAYLVDDSVSKNNKVLGKELYTGTTVKEFEVTRTGLDDYASLAKFMEQAFEWDIMSYNYYPYYWGKRDDWDDMYQSENIDPLFRSFLRSGMARVVVTVRPGFEDAVQFYMATGRLWNGGEVPVIGDPMYLSIVDEMKDIKGEAQGKPWITRLPTSLTILQAQSIGLTVSSALPFTKEDPALFENPEEVITESNFKNTNAMIESGADKQVAKIGLDEDSLQLTTEDD
ncbi:hypothetical protein [Epilithonimonas sp.]|uniref:hypothetical protein n=1 Tax=Epilithonimonas sp. TaxID=2894511 RepID=UPI0028963FC4|nr:hypothetical protein [Epilithonimonas sp.]